MSIEPNEFETRDRRDVTTFYLEQVKKFRVDPTNPRQYEYTVIPRVVPKTDLNMYLKTSKGRHREIKECQRQPTGKGKRHKETSEKSRITDTQVLKSTIESS